MYNIVPVKINPTALARIRGKSLVKNPYNNQRKTPVVRMLYIPNEISLVFFVLIVFITWGKNEEVVHTAATNLSK